MSQKADIILRGTENKADAIVTLRVYVVINITVTSGDCWHIRTMSDFNKQKANIQWFTLSEYNSIAWFCSISSTKIVSNKLTTEPLHISIQTQHCFVYEWICA